MITRTHRRSSCTNYSSIFSFSEGKRFCFNEIQQDANTIFITFSFLNLSCFETFSSIKSWLKSNFFFFNRETSHLHVTWKQNIQSRTMSTRVASCGQISGQIHSDLGHRRAKQHLRPQRNRRGAEHHDEGTINSSWCPRCIRKLCIYYARPNKIRTNTNLHIQPIVCYRGDGSDFQHLQFSFEKKFSKLLGFHRTSMLTSNKHANLAEEKYFLGGVILLMLV